LKCDDNVTDVVLPGPAHKRKKTFSDMRWSLVVKYGQLQTFLHSVRPVHDSSPDSTENDYTFALPWWYILWMGCSTNKNSS
jgi:hypothetical protein